MGTRMALIFLNSFSQTLMNSPGRNTQNNWTFKSVTSVRRGKEVAGPVVQLPEELAQESDLDLETSQQEERRH